eukprot:1150302-Pelagomonas_calceolata.AAC.4
MATSVLPKNTLWNPPVEPGCTMQAMEGVCRPAGACVISTYLLQTSDFCMALILHDSCHDKAATGEP